MFWVESNAEQVAAAMKAVVRDVGHFAKRRQAGLMDIAREGTSDHFMRLGQGGSDPSALGGGVSWSLVGSELTFRERGEKPPKTAKGVAPKRRGKALPLLDHTGHMKGAFTTDAVAGSDARGGWTNPSSSFSHGAADSFAIIKARENQEGGVHVAHFPKIGRSKHMEFPARPFLYWDTNMVDRVMREATHNFEESVAAHRPGGAA